MSVSRLQSGLRLPRSPRRVSHAHAATRRRSRRALTLLEVLIAITLIGMLMGALLTFYWQTLSVRDKVIAQANRTELIQQTLGRICTELRAALGVSKIGYPVQRFSGDRRTITFLLEPLPPESSYVAYQPNQTNVAPQQDLHEITWSLWIDPLNTKDNGDPIVGGLMRDERRVMDPVIPESEAAEQDQIQYVRHELVSPELGYLEFRYFDGVQWSTTWSGGQGNPLPQQIQVTIGFDSIKKEDVENSDLEDYPVDRYPLGPDTANAQRYSTIVQLVGADSTLSNRLSSLSGANGENGQPSGMNGGMQNGGMQTGGLNGQAAGGDRSNEGTGP